MAEQHSEVDADPFFGLGDRQSHLDQLRHLSQWSRRVLLVTGPRGVGKSTLYRQLAATLEPRAQAALVNGALVNGSREVLNAMVQGFGLAAPADADSQLLRGLIADHAEAQSRSERFCVLLVDDAELLEAKALEQLMALAAGAPLRMVLFGEIRLAAAADRGASTHQAGWHEIRLAGFDPGVTRAYLEWRFSRQGHTGPLPFSDSQVKQIARLSEGLPGRIDQMANVLLAKIQSGGLEPPGRRFPALHRALLAVLAVAVAFAYLVWQPGDETPGTEWSEVERRAPPPRPAPAAQQQEMQQQEMQQQQAQQRPVPAARQDPAETEMPASQPPQYAGADDDAGSQPPTGPPQSPPQRDDPNAGTRSASALSGTEEPAPEHGLDVAGVEREAAGHEDVGSGSGPSADPSGSEPAATGARDAAWIMRQPASAYTLQLVSFSTADRADAYVAGQADPSQFARFRLQQSGRILHVVIFGVFDGRAAAEQAPLPDTLGQVKPWIRTYAQVQEAARTALQTR